MANVHESEMTSGSNEHSLVMIDEEEFIEAALLDQIEDCMNCVEGVESQNDFENKTISAAAHGLTKDETLLIRSKLLEEQRLSSLQNETLGSDFNTVVDLCGLEDLPTVIWHCVACKDSKEECKNHKTLNSAPTSSPCLKELTSTSKQQYCAICLDGKENDDKSKSMNGNSVTFAHLPCCGSYGREESSLIKICTVCILLLTLPNSDGSERIGRCPRCRSWITVKSNAVSTGTSKSKKKTAVAPVVGK